ncbi:MAG TPA: hypothetical protein VLH84_00325 [Patescibacteria group bacterium]|nr:hypothetical protein [Patescibacteria group bacterium]
MLHGEIVHISDAQGGVAAHVENVATGGEPYVLKTHTTFDVNGEH